LLDIYAQIAPAGAEVETATATMRTS
jgi:hypothetical protein